MGDKQATFVNGKRHKRNAEYEETCPRCFGEERYSCTYCNMYLGFDEISPPEEEEEEEECSSCHRAPGSLTNQQFTPLYCPSCYDRSLQGLGPIPPIPTTREKKNSCVVTMYVPEWGPKHLADAVTAVQMVMRRFHPYAHTTAEWLDIDGDPCF